MPSVTIFTVGQLQFKTGLRYCLPLLQIMKNGHINQKRLKNDVLDMRKECFCF